MADDRRQQMVSRRPRASTSQQVHDAGSRTPYADRVPLFCGSGLAARIERAEAQLIAGATEATRRRRADGGGFVTPVAGGVATFAEDGSPYNKIAGLGFGGLPDAAALDVIERAFAGQGAAVQAEVASLADPALVDMLTAREYRLASFENVLGRELTTGSQPVEVPGIEVRRSGPDELDAWVELVTDAAVHPDTQGVPMEEFPRDTLERAERDSAAIDGIRRYVALRHDQLAGGASLRIAGGVAQLTGAGTVPAHRRNGVQTALLAARLADAAAEGCDVAVVTTQPGSKSQQNVQRRGFDLLYTRAVLLRHP
jgi:GNAT superfamily N-acetyltransferase